MKIILGGSFDPIHKGHIAMIQYLHSLFKVGGKIMIMPNTGNLNYKSSHLFSTAERRKMIEIVVAKYPELCELCDIELRVAEYTPTIKSVKNLHEIYPDEMLYFVIGFDSLLSLETWHDWQDLCQSLNFIVFSRNSGTANLQIPLKLQNYLTPTRLNEIASSTSYGHISFIDGFNIDISSTEIRARIMQGKLDWEDMVDEDVAIYIKSIKG